MGGGAEKKKTNQMLAEDRSRSQKQDDSFQSEQGGRSGTAYGRQNTTYDDLYSGYKGLADGTAGGSGGGGGGSVGMDPRYKETEAFYRNSMGKEGGYDPTRVANMDKDIAGMRGMGKFGAADEASAARLRGGGVWDEMAKTGGVTEAEAYGIRDRASATGRAQFAGAQDELGRTMRATGGSAMAGGAAMARMARQGSQSANQGALNAETDIAGMRREGRLAGAGGMSASENQIISNQQSGMGSAFAAEHGLAEGVREGQQYGTAGLTDVADKSQANARSNASAGRANSQYNDRMKLVGLEGLGGLREQEMSNEGGYDRNRLNSRGMYGNQAAAGIDQRMSNNPQRDWAKTIGSVVGSAAGAMTGLGALGVGVKAAKAVGGR